MGRHSRGVERIAWRGNERAYAPAISLSSLDNAKRSSVFHAPTRVLEFCFAIDFRACLLRETFQEDLNPLCSDTVPPTERVASHERSVSYSTSEAVHGL